MKELSKRIITGIIGIILLIYVVNRGGVLLSGSLFLISLIGLREFNRAINKIGLNSIKYVGPLAVLGIFFSTILPSISLNFIITICLLILLVSLIMVKGNRIVDVAVTLLSIFYIPFMLFHVYYLENSVYIWLVFIIAFGTDTFAFIAGNLFGKRKLAKELSPNKTIEGAIGGVIGSMALTIFYSLYMNINPIWKLVILSLIASVASQTGDLVASKIKRITGVKDFGFIMPGHGGVLDRFDSIIFSAPLIYYYVTIFLI